MRKTVPLVCGEKYHIYNRGVDKRDIFISKNDYIRFYLSLGIFNTLEPTLSFEDSKNKKNTRDARLVKIFAYSLLPNHFHLILEQSVEGGISELMKRLTGGYTSYFNDKHDRSGSLFQGRFKRIHIDTNEYYQYLFAYVNENHTVHNLERPNDICYSSSIHYQGIANSRLIECPSTRYQMNENRKLAKIIQNKRSILKCES